MLNKFIQLNSKVVLKNGEHSFKYQIVTPDKVDPSNNKISCEAPIGKSLLNHQENEEVCVQTPSGTKSFQIVSVF